MKANLPTLSIIVPAFNEGPHIHSNLEEIERVARNLSDEFEIVVVDDGSTDGTYDEIMRFANQRKNVRVVNYTSNKGKGHALLKGVEVACGDLIAFIDADLDLHPSQLSYFISAMKETNADIVIGSKRHPLSRVKYPPQRKFLSDAYHLITRLLFGLNISDTQAGLKLFKGQVLKKLSKLIVVKEYAFDLELLVNAHRFGYKIKEVPILIDFKRPFNRLNLAHILKIWIDTMAIFYRIHVLGYYDKKWQEMHRKGDSH